MRPLPRSVVLKAALWRWREALAGLALMAFALWVSLASFGITRALGYALAVAAMIVILAGLQRGRFRRGGGGPGVVLVREAQVAYFGPHHGGSVNIGSLTRLELDQSDPSLPQWLLTEEGQPPLAIPTSAEGAEGLFDVFAALPGIETERMLAALQGATAQPNPAGIGGSEFDAMAAQAQAHSRARAAALQQFSGQSRVLIWGAPYERPRLALVH